MTLTGGTAGDDYVGGDYIGDDYARRRTRRNGGDYDTNTVPL